MTEVKVEGLSELLKALEALPVELHKGPLRSAVAAGAKVVQDEAKRLAPRSERSYLRTINGRKQRIAPGTLQRAIYRTRSRDLSVQIGAAVQEAYIVGVRYGKKYQRRGLDAWYWRFVEFGTRNMTPHPFLRPAFHQTKDRQIEAMRVRLAKAIERAANKLRRR